MSRADYGIDAPPVVRNLAAGGGAFIIVALLDYTAIDEYLSTLKSFGWQDSQSLSTSFLMFPPVRVVRGKKPA